MPTLYDNFSQVRQYIDQEKPDLSSYVTKSELSGCSYVTSSDLPIINENIVPKENNTYTLGNSTYLYKEAYISNIYTTEFNRIYSSSNYNYYFQINGANRFYMDTIGFYGNADGARNLGSSTNNFGSTYTQNLYLGGTNIKTTINGMFSYDSTTGTLTITTIS